VANKTKDKDMWLDIIPQKNAQHIVKTKGQTLTTEFLNFSGLVWSENI